ncbi:MAG: peptidase M28 family protein, partial [Reichenbachiella sp.]
MKKQMLVALMLLFSAFATQAQNHEQNLRTIFDEALTNGQSYPMLEYLSLNIGHRLSGSPSAAAAVEYTRQQMEAYGFDKVYLQEVMVPHWVRGQKEIGRIVNSKFGSQDVSVIALGNSVGTGPEGLLAEVIEVQSLDELEKLGKKNIEGKIVFFNRPMD